MVHIVTSHHNTEEFILPQIHFIKENIEQEYKIWAYYDPEDRSKIETYKKYFHYLQYPPDLSLVSKHYKNVPGDLDAHYLKLDKLTEIICNDKDTSDDDILLFLDGDSFPINPLDNFLEATLKKYKLAGIQRLENGFDIQPHGSFTITRVKTFRELNLTWSPGYPWSNSHFKGLRTDVGGEILKKLIDTRTIWYPLHRSNKYNIHPVCFGVYDDLIYHHGAGFRGVMNANILSAPVKFNTEKMYAEAKVLENRLIGLEKFYDILI